MCIYANEWMNESIYAYIHAEKDNTQIILQKKINLSCKINRICLNHEKISIKNICIYVYMCT